MRELSGSSCASRLLATIQKSQAGQRSSEAPAREAATGELRFAAIALMCAAMVCFAALDTSAKWLSATLPTVEVVWARYVGAAMLGLVAARPLSRPGVLRARRPWLQIMRSALLLGSTLANFLALRRLQLAETSTISFLTPLFVVLMAGPWLGERVGAPRYVAIAVGFGGVLVATRPGTSAFQPIVVVAIAGVACNAAYALATRMLAGQDAPQTTLAWTPIAGVAALTPLLPWSWQPPDGALVWLVIVNMGVCGALGHWLLILAHQRAPASVLTPFSYTQLLWMIVSGALVFGDTPPTATLVGAGLVVACGLFLVLHERGARSRDASPPGR
jgi:drug/metabolite transporter (DMT)-like permease